MMNNVQGDCKHGSTGFPAGEDLTLATGKLAKLNADGHVVLPTADTDITPYVITCGADQGYLCGVFPLTSISNSRVVLKGACQAGQLLVAVGDGRVEAGTLGGTALPVGVAEEDGVEGQHVLLRPLSVGARGADGAAGEDGADGAAGAEGPAGTAGADGAAGAQGPAGPAGADGADGADGAAGPQGPAGADGADGAVGMPVVIDPATVYDPADGTAGTVVGVGQVLFYGVGNVGAMDPALAWFVDPINVTVSGGAVVSSMAGGIVAHWIGGPGDVLIPPGLIEVRSTPLALGVPVDVFLYGEETSNRFVLASDGYTTTLLGRNYAYVGATAAGVVLRV